MLGDAQSLLQIRRLKWLKEGLAQFWLPGPHLEQTELPGGRTSSLEGVFVCGGGGVHLAPLPSQEFSPYKLRELAVQGKE